MGAVHKNNFESEDLNMASVCPKGIEQKIRLMLESGYVAEPSVLTKKTSKSMKRGHHLQNRNANASGSNQGAIDNRIEQAMDLVKSHLMNAVRSEVEELKEKIIKLEETISQQSLELTKQHTDFNREVGKLQAENEFLRTQVGPEVITQLSNLQTVNQQQNQVQQNIQDSQSIQVSATKQAAPSTQPQQTHQ